MSKDKEKVKPIITKMIVEPTGPFILVDPNTRQEIDSRPTVVKSTNFIQEKVYEGILKLLTPKLPAEATDEEFQKYVVESKGDIDLAIAAFTETFGLDENGNKIS